MPLRKPNDGESQSDFMTYCMHELAQSDTQRSNEQMVAICLRAYRENKEDPRAKFADLIGEVADLVANGGHHETT